MSKEQGKGNLSYIWSDNDSLDDMLNSYVQLEIFEKEQRDPPAPGCSHWKSPVKQKYKLKSPPKPKIRFPTTEINDLLLFVQRYPDAWDDMETNLP